MGRNDFYQMVDQYMRNNPEATAPEVWAHFMDLARSGFVACIVAADPASGWIEIIPDLQRVRTKRISKPAFRRRCSFLKREKLQEIS